MEGWIKIHRKILNWEWFQDDNTFRIFLYLLLTVNHKDKKWKGIMVNKASTISSLNSIKRATGVSYQSIRTSLGRLKSTGEITIKSTNKYSIITICNYDAYQIEESDANKQTNTPINNQSTNNQQQTRMIKNDKKEESFADFEKRKKIEDERLEKELEQFRADLLTGER